MASVIHGYQCDCLPPLHRQDMAQSVVGLHEYARSILFDQEPRARAGLLAGVGEIRRLDRAEDKRATGQGRDQEVEEVVWIIGLTFWCSGPESWIPVCNSGDRGPAPLTIVVRWNPHGPEYPHVH